MKRTVVFFSVLLLSLSMGAQQFAWKTVEMDGSRTGCSAPGADNVEEALGRVEGRSYYAPNGRVYRKGSVPRVAATVIAAQPAMADLKQVVGFSERGMSSRGGNTPLANFATDAMLECSESIFGVRADLAILNSGGIRASVPKGKVLKDDIVSIFPFRNYVVLVEWPGSVLLNYLEHQAVRYPQPVAGVEMHIRDHKLVSASIGGKAIDPDAIYRLVTIDFLLGSGDNMRLAEGARDIRRTQVLVFDVIMDRINALTAAGKTLDAAEDGRVVFE